MFVSESYDLEDTKKKKKKKKKVELRKSLGILDCGLNRQFLLIYEGKKKLYLFLRNGKNRLVGPLLRQLHHHFGG